MNRSFAILSAVLAFSAPAYAQSSASHNVSVQLLELSDISIDGGDVSIVLDEFDSSTNWVKPESDQSTELEFRHTSAASQKITVETDNADPAFDLSVEARDPSNGTAAGDVQLSTVSQDFLSDIAAGQGEADLRYTASAPMGAAAGTDSHTVTYTLLAM